MYAHKSVSYTINCIARISNFLLKLAFVVCHPLRLKLYQILSSPLLRNSIAFAFSKRWRKILIDAFTTFSTGLFCSKMVGTRSYTADAGTSDLTDVDAVCL